MEHNTGNIRRLTFLKTLIFYTAILFIIRQAEAQHTSVDECIEKITLDLYYNTELHRNEYGKLYLPVVLEGETDIGKGIISRLKQKTKIQEAFSFERTLTGNASDYSSRLSILVYQDVDQYVIEYDVRMDDNLIAKGETALSYSLASNIRKDDYVMTKPVSEKQTKATPKKSISSSRRDSGDVWLTILGIAAIVGLIYLLAEEGVFD